MNDLQIYEKAASLIRGGENVALVTIVSTTGSTPGKAGYKMLVWGREGNTMGTVGGGLAEGEMIKAAKISMKESRSEALRFDFGGAGDDEKGVCGGTAEFLIEGFNRRHLALFEELSKAIADGRKGVLVSLISAGREARKFFLERLDQISTIVKSEVSAEALQSIAELAAKEECAKMKLAEGVEAFVEAIGERPMLFIFGAGHLACHIARLAEPLGFRVTVCDEREEYANRQRFPNVDNIVVESYERIFSKLNVDRNAYVVIVTRGHKCDELVLEQVLRKDAKYIGMIGSKRKTLTIMKSLGRKGLPEEKLRKVYSPIGISIGAVTPEEIALSIVSELTKIRRLGDSAGIGHMRLDFLNEEEEKDK
jgi:xanthine dehydrogenase accessory factor